MYGRYDNLIAREAYPTLYRAMRLPASNFPPRYNIAPTDQVPIDRIDPRDGARELVMARWGLIPFWMKKKPKVPHINARAETVHKLPLFREAFAKRRALIPATGFFESQLAEDGGKQPWCFVRVDNAALLVCRPHRHPTAAQAPLRLALAVRGAPRAEHDDRHDDDGHHRRPPPVRSEVERLVVA
jgi:putative SOS response-associated peptidase YedK